MTKCKVVSLLLNNQVFKKPRSNLSTLFYAPSSAFSTSHGLKNPAIATPSKCDVCIIGGGAMGSSAAYWLKQHPEGRKLNVVVVERDPKYTKASTVLSLGGIRQQFSNGENVQLSLFGSKFIERIQEHLGVPGSDPVDIQYRPGGYLFLATSPTGAEILHENHLVQREYDSKVKLITKDEVKQRFPMMNVDDITLASIGLENEGWFDPWSLLNGFKKKAISLGVQYVTGEVVGFEENGNVSEAVSTGPTQVYIKDDHGVVNSLEFSQCVIAAGYDSGNVGKLAGIGTGSGVLSVPIPVEPKKRYVYFINAPSLAKYNNIPLCIDSCGTYFRPEGAPGNFVCGRSPADEEEPSCEDLEVDYTFFDTHVWPSIANRVPDFESLKIKSAYGAYYDYNIFDQNGIIGTHPVFTNFHIATGFSGHGIQQSPATGLAIMELILYGSFKNINLTKFGFERIINGTKVLERNIV